MKTFTSVYNCLKTLRSPIDELIALSGNVVLKKCWLNFMPLDVCSILVMADEATDMANQEYHSSSIIWENKQHERMETLLV